MRIALYMTTVLEYGGGLEKYLIETASNLSKNPDIIVDVITMDNSFTERIVSLLSIFYLKRIDIKLSFKESSEDIRRRLGKSHYYKEHSIKNLRKRLNRYDVIYSKNELLEGFLFKFLVRYNLVPPIVFGGHTPIFYPDPSSFHSRLHNYLYCGMLYKFLAGGVRKFHAINSQDEKMYKRLFPKKEVRNIPNPFNFHEFKMQAKKSPYNVAFPSPSSTKILWIGRLTEQKGVPDLVEIIRKVNEKISSKSIVSWTIVGDGEQKDLVERVSKDFQNVHMLGYVDQKYTASIYSQHDILLNTSKWEGYPYTLLEAAAFDLRILAYEISGTTDVLSKYPKGKLLRNRKQMISEIYQEIINPLKETKKSSYPAEFNPDQIYQRLIDFLTI
jgi:glycosyltransferase involved in cell wall biosynthesis